jgi:lipopolysaccharide transport system ATP-binding protein
LARQSSAEPNADLPMSSDSVAVAVRGISKKYTIRHDRTAPTTLGEALARRLRNPFWKLEREEFWALRDVSFDVQRGEVLGLIGRNGAGKSTLLKILSRITEMTEGEVVLDGRVGSLLEVGTGFNQELTGRENIFLNGAILGMTRAEIRDQFDAIVEFSGVERFLDTPVKHYSSGMYVRLAFAVAAHLRSDILIVDEVLAVGDQEFQRKCLGKMRDVATGGRTVMLVSHNMTAIASLCSHAVVLDVGKVVFAGEAGAAITRYASNDGAMLVGDLRQRRDRSGNGEVRSLSISVRDARGRAMGSVRPHEPFEIVVAYEAMRALPNLAASIDVEQLDGTRIATLYSAFHGQTFHVSAGRGALVCHLDGLPLRPDTYSLNVFLGANHAICDFVERAMSFEVAPCDVFGTGRMPDRNQGPLLAGFRWNASMPVLAGTEEITT